MENKEIAIQLYESGSKNYRKICMLYNDFSIVEMKGCHVHHLNGNHKDNNPVNLKKCTPEEHAEFHKEEGLSKWISLQHYAAVKGGKVLGKMTKEASSIAMKKGWANATPEARQRRIDIVNAASNSPEKNKQRSEKMTGVKKPIRTEEHLVNWKKSKSIGMWVYRDIEEISSVGLAKKLNVDPNTARRWTKYKNSHKINLRQVKLFPHIFELSDIGTTFKQKGFSFLNKPLT